MKIQCPNCEAVYNINDSTIPEKGAHVTCRKCQTRFHIKKEQQAEKEDHQEEIIPCSNCGHWNISTDTCVNCGTVFSKEDKEKLAVKISKED